MTVWNDEELRKIRYPVYDELTEKLARWLLEQREITRRTQLQLGEATSLLRRLYELQQNEEATNGSHPEFCDCMWCHNWAAVRVFLNPGSVEA
ncbi:MAG TPA: hypothetical protein VEA41_07340 [Salinarimonas sp.]|nr:hypothetical protein [Salinarimonas sp.]